MRSPALRTYPRKSVATDTSEEFSWAARRHLAIEMPIRSSRGPGKEHVSPTSSPSRRHRYHATVYFVSRMLHPVWPRKTTNQLAHSNPHTAVPELGSRRKD